MADDLHNRTEEDVMMELFGSDDEEDDDILEEPTVAEDVVVAESDAFKELKEMARSFAREPEPKARRKRRKRTRVEGDESGDDGGYFEGEEVVRARDVRDEDEPQGDPNPIDEAVSRLKTRRRRRGDPLHYTEESLDFVRKMDDVVQRDRAANRAGEPATNMLRLLPQVYDYLLDQTMANELVESGVLAKIGSWLWILPDGSLPPAEVRTVLLKRLDNLHISPADLKDDERAGDIGKAVRFLSSCKDELSSNRRLAHTIMTKWVRLLFSLQTDHSKREVEVVSVVLPEGGAAVQRSRAPGKGEAGYTYHASIPRQNVLKNLNRRPIASGLRTTEPVHMAEGERLARFQKKHQTFMRDPKPVATAAKMKIGAGMT